MVARTHFLPFVDRARRLRALPAAFVYPCDRASLQLALSSAFTSTLAPVLVGPEIRIRDVASHAGIDIARLPIEDTVDDPRASARRAAALARAGRVAALVKGSLGNDLLLAPVTALDSGLHGLRRLSHAYFLDLPGQPRGILLADAEINVAPSLAVKRDILHNTIGLAHALGVAAPSVALLSARDTISPALPATGDAAALRAMAGEGIFGDAVVDGPLTAASALSAAAAQANGRDSAVAGHADILIVPDLQSGALLLSTLTCLTGGLAAGLVLGADLPIVAPAPTDSMEVRIASCVLASLLAAYLAEQRDEEAQHPASAPAVQFVTHAAA
jgi:phosphate acetyltransferase